MPGSECGCVRWEGGGGGDGRQAGALDFVRIQPLDLSFLSDG